MTELEISLKDQCDNNKNRYSDIYYANYMDNKHFDSELLANINTKWEQQTDHNDKNELLMSMCFDRWRLDDIDYSDAKRLGNV